MNVISFVQDEQRPVANALLQGHQALIDLLSLLDQCLVVELRVSSALGACQVDQEHFTVFQRFQACVLDSDLADGMRSTRVVVLEGGSSGPVLCSLLVELQEVLWTCDLVLQVAFDLHLAKLVLAYRQTLARVEKVSGLFAEQLEEGYEDLEDGAPCLILRDFSLSLEQVDCHSLLDALHGEGLAGTGLSIGEDHSQATLDAGTTNNA